MRAFVANDVRRRTSALWSLQTTHAVGNGGGALRHAAHRDDSMQTTRRRRLDADDVPITQRMPVAQLRPAARGSDTEVMFLESPRIYSVRATTRARDRIVVTLQDALNSHKPVSVTFSPIKGGEISDVRFAER